MKKNIPVYEFVISEDDDMSGVSAISVVNKPAFESKIKLVFSQIRPQFITLADKSKKRKICGLALIPNTPVFRIDDVTGEEYMGYFSVDTIEKIVEKFHAELNNNKVNLGHNDNQFINAVLIEDFIVNSKSRVEDLKDIGITHENIMGSWFTKYLIKDEKALNEIEMSMAEGNPVGLSVECYLDKIISKMSEQINKNNLKIEMRKNNKSILEKIIEIFSKEELERVLVPELAITLEVGKPGEVVNQVTTDEKGVETLTPVGPGEFNTDAGIVVVDESSNLLEVRPVPVEQATDVVAPDVVPQPESDKVDTVTGKTSAEETELKAYPWDQCISNQLGAGYSQEAADKICGWIKANNSSQEMVTDEVLQSILTPDEYACKKKKLDDFSIKLDEDLVDPVAEVSPDMMPPDGTDPNAPPAPDVKSKTIGEIVGENDGEYWVKVVVSGGLVTEAEVSSETDLLKTSLEEVQKENTELKDKLKEPIGEPQLQPEVEKKDWAKMSTYERVLQRTRMNQEK